MSVTTLTELQTAIADRIARSDFTTSQQNECIAFAESRMRRELRTQDMSTRTETISIFAEFVPVPPNFLLARAFELLTDPRVSLKFMPNETMVDTYNGSGPPRFFCTVGKEFRFAPIPDGTYTARLVYYQTIPSLTTATPTNWLLTSHPDAYLYGSLLECAIRVRDVDAATGYKSLFDESIAAIKKDAADRRWVGPMQTRPG